MAALETITDEELVKLGWLGGDREAAEELDKRWRDRLVSYASSLLNNNRCEAEECADVTIYKAVIKAKDFHGASFEGWIKAICRNAAHDMRKKQTFSGLPDEVEETLGDEVPSSPHEEACDKVELVRAALKECAHELTDKQYMELNLHLFGMSFGDIAKMLGRSKSTIQSNVQRARDKMEKWIKEHGPINE